MFALPIGFFQPAASVATGLLLDSISATVVGAYGTRKLRSAYGGACIKVRRSSDNLELNIGFTGAGFDLDQTALIAHVTSNGANPTASGYISIWYDNSTAGQNIVQTVSSQQPAIVLSGVVQLLGGTKPSPVFTTAGTTWLEQLSFTYGGSAYAMFAVASRTASSTTYARLSAYFVFATNDYAITSNVIFAYAPGSNLRGHQSGDKSTMPIGTSAFQASSVFNGSSHTMTVDGTAGTAVAAAGTLTTTAALRIGTGSSTDYWDGRVGEAIYTSGTVSSADIATIRASQRTYYGTP